MIVVFGEIRSFGTAVPSQRTLQHWSGLSVIGSSGPRLPWPVLPPPSRLKRPLLPSLTQMPHVPLSLATLSRISCVTLGTKMP